MRIGKLRHRLELQEKTATRGSYGEEIVTWTTKRVVWGSVEPLSGTEYFASKQTQTEVSHRIRIRYCEDISPEWQIKFGKKTLNIESVINPQERGKEMILMCKE